MEDNNNKKGIQDKVNQIRKEIRNARIDLAVQKLDEIYNLIEDSEIKNQLILNTFNFNDFKKKDLKNIASENEINRIAAKLLKVCDNIETWLNADSKTGFENVEKTVIKNEPQIHTNSSDKKWLLYFPLLLGGFILGLGVHPYIFSDSKLSNPKNFQENRTDSTSTLQDTILQDSIKSKGKEIASLKENNSPKPESKSDDKTSDLKNEIRKIRESADSEKKDLEIQIEELTKNNKHLASIYKICESEKEILEFKNPNFKGINVQFHLNSSIDPNKICMLKGILRGKGMTIESDGKGGKVSKKNRIDYSDNPTIVRAAEQIRSELEKIKIEIEIFKSTDVTENKIDVQI